MPSKKPAKKSQSYNNPLFKGFININLTDEQRSEIKESPFGDGDFESRLMERVDSGFKFTFSRDERYGSFQVVGQRTDYEHEDYGVLLSGRGSTPLKAFKQWLYLATYIGDSRWTDWLKPNTQYDLDD